jgi:predicted dehydrogenase
VKRAAVIGLGRHGLRHLQAYLKLPDVEVVAVCDMRAENVNAALDQVPNAKGYEQWEDLLANEQVDVISVVTNGPSHAPITISAARSGVKYIFCEKPFATSIKDGLEMIEVCKENGTRLSVCHARRWVDSYQQLRDMIAAGVIGKVCQFSFSCGGGLFAGNGTHFMDLARMLGEGSPISVTGVLDKTGTPNPRGEQFKDPGAVALYYFDNGMRMMIDMFEDLGVPHRIEIIGSIGRILIDELDNRWEVQARQGEDRERPLGEYWLPLKPVELKPGVLDMVQMLVDGLKELLADGEITCTGEDGLKALQMVIGAHVSSERGGVPITLPLAEEFRSIDIPLT